MIDEQEPRADKQRLDERFELLERIGAGGMGIVYRAYDHRLKRTVVVKKLRFSASATTRQIQRMQREARALARLDHVNVLKILDFGGVDGESPYLIAEYIEGMSLDDLIDEGSLSIEEAISLALQIGAGLENAHKHGILHRDLKPSNILVDSNNTVKIIDLGLAGFADDQQQRITEKGMAVGSPLYMSPQQIHGMEPGESDDIYAFGCLLYAMLTGAPPFTGASTLEIVEMHLSRPAPSLAEGLRQAGDLDREKQFSPELERLIATCLEKSPADRFHSMKAIIEELMKLLENRDEMAIAAQSTIVDRSPKQIPALFGAAVILSVVLPATISWLVGSQPPVKRSYAVHHNRKALADDDAKNVQYFSDRCMVLSGNDNSLRHLRKNVRFSALEMSGTDVTGEGLKHVPGANLILKLDMRNTRLDDSGAHHIAAMSSLENLNVGQCTRLTHDGISAIANLTELRRLTVGHRAKDLTLSDFEELSRIKKLEALCIMDQQDALPHGYANLLQPTRLREFHFTNCARLTADNLQELADLKRPIGVWLVDQEINATETGSLAALPQLEAVGFTNCRFEPQAIVQFRKLNKFIWIRIDRSLIDTEQVSELATLSNVGLEIFNSTIAPNAADRFGQIRRLKLLAFHNVTISKKLARALADLPNLISFEDCSFQAGAIIELGSVKRKEAGRLTFIGQEAITDRQYDWLRSQGRNVSRKLDGNIVESGQSK